MLEIENLTFSYGSKMVLNGVNLRSRPMVNVIIGPNATGKSTLLKCIAGILKPQGTISIDGKNIDQIEKEDFTRQVSYLPQENTSHAALTVFEAVLLGRHHSLSWRVKEDHLNEALEVLIDLGIEDLVSRHLNELSGGQQQMVSIAQALIKNPQILLMDEPTSSLDLQRQLELFDLIEHITQKRKIITLIALHDLNLAARYADKIIVLNKGNLYAIGNPVEVLTPDIIRSVYGVNSRVSIGDDGIPVVTPINSVRFRAR